MNSGLAPSQNPANRRSSHMERIYYIGEGPECVELIELAISKATKCRYARTLLINDYSAHSLLLNDKKTPVGLLFDKPSDELYLRGVPGKMAPGYGYFPNLNTREGRQLAARLASEDVQFDTNGFIAEKIGLGKEYTEGNIHYMPRVSIRSLKICFSVPIRRRIATGTQVVARSNFFRNKEVLRILVNNAAVDVWNSQAKREPK